MKPPTKTLESLEETASSRSTTWLLDALAVDPSIGLSGADVAVRQKEFGPNAIGTVERTSYLQIFVNQFRGAVVWLLLAAAALSVWLRDAPEAIAIFVVLVVNTAIGFTTELRAAKSMDALRKLTHTPSRVRRNGREISIDADDLVPGDIVVLEAGDLVPADIRLLSSVNLHVDESTLTGESLPVEKSTDAIAGDLSLADRRNMVFRGTSVTRGGATGITTATGMRTQLGTISELISGAEGESTPLERRLDQLGKQLAIGALLVSFLIAAAGFIMDRPLLIMLETGLALAVAAVPEGLPIVATLALARGMWRMAARNVLINRLSAVETLGSTSVLMTDKTGTLTENRMAVDVLVLSDETLNLDELPPTSASPRLLDALQTMALCNDAVIGGADEDAKGDPMELALLRAALALGQDPEVLQSENLRRDSVAFDPATKMMATLNGDPEAPTVHVKGAPEAVLAASSEVITKDGAVPLTAAMRADLAIRVEAAGSSGLRLIGLARARAPVSLDDVYHDLSLIGFVGLRDPARSDVPRALAECHKAGVRVIMVTGDHKATAQKIAEDVGLTASGSVRADDGNGLARMDEPGASDADLLATDVFARVRPQDKLTLVALHQKNGSVVAMTGDGVNDAPALRKADIGIAMGKRGTQVAAEASDIILRDDAFGSIVEAMRQGRIIFENIRAFIRYLFTCNLSEILLIAFATLAGLPMPLAPLQILFLNLITDIFPAIALGFGEGSDDVMEIPPRDPMEPVIGRNMWIAIVLEGSLLAISVLAAFVHELDRIGAEAASGSAFLTLCVTQLFYVFAIYRKGESLISSQITRNPYVWGAVVFSAGIMLLGVFVPTLSTTLKIPQPDAHGWAVILLAGAFPTVLTSLFRLVRRS